MIIDWFLWSLVLLSQNFAFTYVSRARSSGSLLRHLKASFFSNGIWIFSQMLLLGPMFDNLTGKHGHALQAVTGLVYTTSTMTGSIAAHYWALRTEKGKSAVGASKLYAQIPVGDWEYFQQVLAAAKKRGLPAESLPLPIFEVSNVVRNGDGSRSVMSVTNG